MDGAILIAVCAFGGLAILGIGICALDYCLDKLYKPDRKLTIDPSRIEIAPITVRAGRARSMSYVVALKTAVAETSPTLSSLNLMALGSENYIAKAEKPTRPARAASLPVNLPQPRRQNSDICDSDLDALNPQRPGPPELILEGSHTTTPEGSSLTPPSTPEGDHPSDQQTTTDGDQTSQQSPECGPEAEGQETPNEKDSQAAEAHPNARRAEAGWRRDDLTCPRSSLTNRSDDNFRGDPKPNLNTDPAKHSSEGHGKRPGLKKLASSDDVELGCHTMARGDLTDCAREVRAGRSNSFPDGGKHQEVPNQSRGFVRKTNSGFVRGVAL